MRQDWWIAVLLVLASVVYFAAPPRQSAMTRAVVWWNRFGWEAQTNLLPNSRGLNVAVLDAAGRLREARAFDTYLRADSGFAEYISALSGEIWVVVAVQDDGATSLSPSDLAALEYLGGTDALKGRQKWAYVLVGRPGLKLGAAREWLDPKMVSLSLPAGEQVAGRALPVPMEIRSAGYDGHSFASLTSGKPGLDALWEWLRVALERA